MKKADLTPSSGVFDFSGHLFVMVMKLLLLGSESEHGEGLKKKSEMKFPQRTSPQFTRIYQMPVQSHSKSRD